jgi:hypothetical protein
MHKKIHKRCCFKAYLVSLIILLVYKFVTLFVSHYYYIISNAKKTLQENKIKIIIIKYYDQKMNTHVVFVLFKFQRF